MRLFHFAAAALFAALTPFAAQAEEKLQVVASFSILGDMVEQVAGDHAVVTTIVGPDADAHIYTPSVADARAVAEADLIFVNGFGFETWSDALIENAGTTAPVIVATDGIEPMLVDGEVDPHAWNSLPNGLIYVENVAEALAAADPANAAAYRANAAAYAAEIEALHAEATAAFAELPAERRTVVTAHDAFGYMAREYDLEFLAPVGIDTEAEPSAQELADLVTQLKEREVAGLFVENITSPALVRQIADETGLEIGGRLFSDALSESGGPATSYVAMYRHNLETLLASLQPAG